VVSIQQAHLFGKNKYILIISPDAARLIDRKFATVFSIMEVYRPVADGYRKKARMTK
jgi:hypothetical protein